MCCCFSVYLSDSVPSGPIEFLSAVSFSTVTMLVFSLALSPFLPFIGESSSSVLLVIILSILLKFATFRILNRQVAESGLVYTNGGVTVGFNHRETDEKIFEVIIRISITPSCINEVFDSINCSI
jgi:hypothetical protein